jgi:predicted nuclease of predicted toxin-antitoxin system
VKLLVDMNLSPSWVERLARHGFEAVHWSTIGAATAPDVEILTWANEHKFVLITNDLDFSAILAATAGASPSAVQIRTQDLLSDVAVDIVAKAIEAHRKDIEGGALLSIDEGGTRVRSCLSRTRGVRRNRNPTRLCNPCPIAPSLQTVGLRTMKNRGTQTRKLCSPSGRAARRRNARRRGRGYFTSVGRCPCA